MEAGWWALGRGWGGGTATGGEQEGHGAAAAFTMSFILRHKMELVMRNTCCAARGTCRRPWPRRQAGSGCASGLGHAGVWVGAQQAQAAADRRSRPAEHPSSPPLQSCLPCRASRLLVASSTASRQRRCPSNCPPCRTFCTGWGCHPGATALNLQTFRQEQAHALGSPPDRVQCCRRRVGEWCNCRKQMQCSPKQP